MATNNPTMMDKPIEKKYFSIGDVAGKLGVTKSCIRYWSNKFELDIYRQAHGYHEERSFTQTNIQKLARIKELLDTGHYTIQGVKAILEGKLYPFL